MTWEVPLYSWCSFCALGMSGMYVVRVQRSLSVGSGWSGPKVLGMSCMYVMRVQRSPCLSGFWKWPQKLCSKESAKVAWSGLWKWPQSYVRSESAKVARSGLWKWCQALKPLNSWWHAKHTHNMSPSNYMPLGGECPLHMLHCTCMCGCPLVSSTCIHVLIHVCTCSHISNTYTQAHIHTCTHTCTSIHALHSSNTHVLKHMYIHVLIHVRVYTLS